MPPRSDLDSATVDAFWDTVAATSPTFVADMIAAAQGGAPTQTPEFREVADRLAAAQPGLLLTVGTPSHGGGRPELVISAGGDRTLFPAVHAVVDAAPQAVRARYRVLGFRPRHPDLAGLRVRLKGQARSPQDIFWTARRDRKDRTRCDLTLFVPGLIDPLPVTSAANEAVAGAVFVLLDHAVGEWAVEAQIGAIEWRSTRSVPGDAQPLTALPDYLDRISAD